MPRARGMEATGKWTGSTFVADGQPYPQAHYGDLVVAYFDDAAGGWTLIPVADLNTAEALFRDVLGRPELHRVRLTSGIHAGRDSSIAWIARCDGRGALVLSYLVYAFDTSVRAAFLDGPGGRALSTLNATYGIRFGTQSVARLTLPAAATLGDLGAGRSTSGGTS